jgi:hypothetical protein
MVSYGSINKITPFTGVIIGQQNIDSRVVIHVFKLLEILRVGDRALGVLVV